jgi:ribosomal protein S18 acetylase RimI-like enzyme
MLTLRTPHPFDSTAFTTLAGGYTTAEVYRVRHEDGAAGAAFALTLTPLAGPRRYTFPYSAEELAHYAALAEGEFAVGAYDGEAWVGVAVGERRDWNRSLWVHEFHVAPGHQRQGVGRRLMDTLAERATAAGLRAVALETQNTNVPAIRFYRAAGFVIEGVDVGYYTNDDLGPDGTVAVFMRRRLA